MRKIVIVLPRLKIGGIERACINFCKQISELYDVTLLLLDNEGEWRVNIPNNVSVVIAKGITFRQQVVDSIRYFRMRKLIKLLKIRVYNNKNWLENLDEYIKLQEPIVESEYDCAIAYHGMNAPSLLTVLYQIRAKKKIAYIHGNHPFAMVKATAEEKYSMFDKLFFASELLMRDYIKDFPKISNISEVYLLLVIKEEILRESYLQINENMSSEFINILTVGRVSSDKGFAMIPDIVEKLIQNGYHIRWYIVGSGDEEETLKQNVKSKMLEDTIYLLGARLNSYPYIRKCDIYVQPTPYEGYCYAIAEAAVLGKPIVGTEMMGIKEELVHGKEALFVAADPQEIFLAIEKLMDKDYREQIAYQASLARFDHSKELTKLIRLLDD